MTCAFSPPAAWWPRRSCGPCWPRCNRTCERTHENSNFLSRPLAPLAVHSANMTACDALLIPPSPRCLAIIPAFNERSSVGAVVRRLKRALPNFDVVVIDDGSTDDTARQIPSGAAVISLPFNLGIGGAMQTRYRYARSEKQPSGIQALR